MKQTAPSARRFVTLRASANNVMRKLEVHSQSASVGLRLPGDSIKSNLFLIRFRQGNRLMQHFRARPDADAVQRLYMSVGKKVARNDFVAV